jgi:hypothetical protein
MIIVKICGGLGNQLFQYATALSIALETNQKLCLDISWYREINNLEDSGVQNATTVRDYLLNNYQINTPIISNYSLNWIKRLDIKSKKSSFYRLLKNRFLKHYSYSKFDSSNYSLEKIKESKNSYLTGYWQNNIIIEKYKKTIKSKFKLNNSISNNLEKYITEIGSRNSVAIHFRRGDYLSKPNSSKIHAICSNKYYQDAIIKIHEKTQNTHFFIFSDEIDWVKSNIDLPDNSTFIEKFGEPYEHLFLMSSCKHQITANSTFSWWAAWLNDYPKKIVITPQQWYYDSILNDTIIRIPNDWIKINNLN